MSQAAAEIIARLEASSKRHETPCGSGTLAWHVWGSGPPVALFHGAQGSWTHWARNIEALAQDHRVLAVDLPGEGDSALPDKQTHDAFSYALAFGLVDLLGPDTPVDLVGFSFGAVVAAFLASYYPAVSRRLVIIGAGGLGTPVGKVEVRSARRLEGEERNEALRHNLLQLMLHYSESADDLAVHILENNAYRSRLDVVSLVLPDRLLEALPRIRCQVDAIWGELDRLHFDAYAQLDAIHTIKPDAEMTVIPDAGHWVMYERAEAFNHALREMLDKPLRNP